MSKPEKVIPVGSPLPPGIEPTPAKNCLSWWFPKIEAAGLPVPRTTVVQAPFDFVALLDGEMPDQAGWDRFVLQLRQAGAAVGWPAFLRSGHMSGKHSWREACFVPNARALPAHVMKIVEWSHLVDLLGLPTNVWAIREMIETKPLFTCEGYGGFPVTREFRFFVRDGEVVHRQPYWPPSAVEEGRPDLDAWREALDDASQLGIVAELELEGLAVQACEAVGGGYWSIDFLQDCHGRWWLTDMAVGERSFRWEPGS